MDEIIVSLKEVLAEIDTMPPVKAEGHDFIEKTCLKTRLELLPSVDAIPVALLEGQVKQIMAEDKQEGVIVVASISGERKNVRYDHAFALCEWYKDKRGWYLTEDVELDDFTVHAWCDLEPYGGGPA